MLMPYEKMIKKPEIIENIVKILKYCVFKK